MAWTASAWLRHIEANAKFISFEPLLAPIHSRDGRFDLTRAVLEPLDGVIIGGKTPYSQKTARRMEWVKEITDSAKYWGIAVFHQDNLGYIFDADGFPKRRELP